MDETGNVIHEASMHNNVMFVEKQPIIFNEIHVLQELKHYLPTQTPLKDFIHHNSLHAFQQLSLMPFSSSKIFGYM